MPDSDPAIAAFPLQVFLWVWAAAGLLQAVLWGVAVRVRNVNAVDLGWAMSLFAAAVGCALVGPGAVEQRLLLGLTAGLWGARLSVYLLVDRVLGEAHEDGRYAELRRHWGMRATRNFFWFFQAQALLAALLALPFAVLAANPAGAVAPLQWGGVALFVTAKIGESIADRQLAGWRRDPANRGRTCRRGMWRYSRHPNYFCEWLIWVAFALHATPAPGGAWVWLAPATMYLFVTRFTGIPYSEAQSLRSRGDDYRAYQRTTSAFFPWFPRPDRGGEPATAGRPAS